MNLDDLRDKIFDLAQDHNENIQLAEDFVNEKNNTLIKQSKKVIMGLEKKIDKIFAKIPDRYPYKNDLGIMINGLKTNSSNLFK